MPPPCGPTFILGIFLVISCHILEILRLDTMPGLKFIMKTTKHTKLWKHILDPCSYNNIVVHGCNLCSCPCRSLVQRGLKPKLNQRLWKPKPSFSIRQDSIELSSCPATDACSTPIKLGDESDVKLQYEQQCPSGFWWNPIQTKYALNIEIYFSHNILKNTKLAANVIFWLEIKSIGEKSSFNF